MQNISTILFSKQIHEAGRQQRGLFLEEFVNVPEKPFYRAGGAFEIDDAGLLGQAGHGTGQDLGVLKTDIVKTGATTDTIRTVASDLRDKVLKAQETIGELRTQLQERKDSDDRVASAVQHIETVIAGSASKGGAGESIIEGMLAEIPAEWKVNNYRVGNKVVEFGLKLPNGLVLPIDSKWAATGLVEELEKCDDPARREELKEEIGSVVEKKARELNKYLDPNFTANFGIAVVPDAVLGACVRKQVDLLKYSVVLVGYSMFVPYLLLVIQTMMKYSKQIDQQKVHNFIHNAEAAVEALRKELDGSLSRALAMLDNSRTELKNQAARLANELSAIKDITEIESKGSNGGDRREGDPAVHSAID